MNDRDIGLLAVGAVGAALIVLLAGAGVILAVGHVVPTEFWAAASSLSGALVGLLAPQPTTKGALTRRAGHYHAMAAAAAAADPTDTKSASLTKVANDATTAAKDPNTKSYDLRVVLLSVVGTAAFLVGIALALSV